MARQLISQNHVYAARGGSVHGQPAPDGLSGLSNMIRNYLKIALRHLLANKGFSFLNITGLAVGLACCMLIALYVYHETHYDRHHARANDLYLVGTTFQRTGHTNKNGGEDMVTFNTPAPLAATLMQEFPEIENATRTQLIFESDKTLIRLLDQNDMTEKAFNETKGYFADSTYFDLFQYQFLEGNPREALTAPQTVVLSDEIARKFFGDAPAYGRTIRISNNSWFEGGDLDFRVTGVVRQPKAASQLDGRFFMSLYSGGLGEFLKRRNDLASNNMFSTYLLLRPGADGKALEAKLPAFVEKYMAGDLKERGFDKKQFLTPLADVHLADIGTAGGEGNNSLMYLYILVSIAAFTLIIACVNFMNLSTARSARRASEVGVRKSVGASRGSLVAQFLGESVLVSLFAFVLALGLARLVLPAFNELTERQLSMSALDFPALYPAFLGLALLTGLFAGVYPAFYLSSFQSAEVLKGRFVNSLSAAFLRKGLVVFQFVVSAGLILASLVIGAQMHYLQSKDLGFYKDRQIVLPLLSKTALAAYQPLKTELQRDNRIAAVGASLYYPGILNPSDVGFRRPDQSKEQAVVTRRNWVDAEYLTTLGVQLAAGRLFSRDFPADTAYKVVVNETGIRKYGFASPEEAIGQKIMFDWRDQNYRFEIIGVVKDFHFESLHEPIEPYSFELNSQPQFNYLVARARECDMGALLASIQETWKRLVPGEPCEYSFLDEDFQKNYKTDTQMAALVGALTGIAILIACLGLLGLAAFAAERRTKEIGIRKVLGASVAGIVGMLTGDFLKLVLMAIIIASPLAWYFMNRWLADFAYRVEMQWWMFVAAGAAAVLIAFLTVGFQSLKAALSHPAQSLRGGE